MKIAVFDDIHTEFGLWQVPALGADVIILAGDIAVNPAGYAAVAASVCEANPGAEVVAILGNHELYGHEFTTAPGKYAVALAHLERVHFLHNSSVELHGVLFAGATLWTDLSGPGLAVAAEVAMNDYKRIRIRRGSGNYQKLRASDTTLEHRRSAAFLEKALTTGNPQRTVIVTHHAPSWRSTPHHEDFEPVYCAQLDDLIERCGPALWVHGHVHKSHDYMIGKTRIRNNPRGYVGAELNPDFEPHLILDLPTLGLDPPDEPARFRNALTL